MKFIPFLAVLVLFASCQNSISGHYTPPKLDTFAKAVYKIQAPNGKILGPFMDTAINQVVSKFVFKDTAHNSGGHWENDSVSYGRISDDTLRDALHKPLYDSAHHILYHYTYYRVIPFTLVPYPH